MEEKLQTIDLSKNEKESLPELAPGTIICDNYEIVKEIDRGGMDSVVYLVKHVKDKQLYAAKIIYKTKKTTETQWKAFKDEIITCTRIFKCPNVVHTHAIEMQPDSNRIINVMDYVNGPSLREVIAQYNHLSVEEAIYIFKKIIIALNSLHSFKHKIIHLDLKPENVMLSSDRSEVKIIDFGISNVLISDQGKSKSLTKKDNMFGTCAYLNPDIIKTKIFIEKDQPQDTMEILSKVMNEQMDFYAFGIMFFETLTGRKPFYAKDYKDDKVMTLPLKYDVPIMSNENPKIPVVLDNIVYRCMASKSEDVENRYHSAVEILQDLSLAERQIDTPTATQLIKPANKRTFQPVDKFNFKLEKNKARFYNTKWFFILLCFVVVCVVIAVIAVAAASR